MNNTVFVKHYDEPRIDRKEILRYCGVKETSREFDKIIDECLHEADGKFTYKVCYCEFSLTCEDGILDIGGIKIVSKDLEKNLDRCNRVIIFAATVGVAIDRVIGKYSSVSPVRSLVFQAIGTERIEALCDAFCGDVRREASLRGEYIKPRFSPGYGDLAIEFQEDVFSLLNCSKNIGLTLNESLLMSPSKSVTAIIGIY